VNIHRKATGRSQVPPSRSPNARAAMPGVRSGRARTRRRPPLDGDNPQLQRDGPRARGDPAVRSHIASAYTHGAPRRVGGSGDAASAFRSRHRATRSLSRGARASRVSSSPGGAMRRSPRSSWTGARPSARMACRTTAANAEEVLDGFAQAGVDLEARTSSGAKAPPPSSTRAATSSPASRRRARRSGRRA